MSKSPLWLILRRISVRIPSPVSTTKKTIWNGPVLCGKFVGVVFDYTLFFSVFLCRPLFRRSIAFCARHNIQWWVNVCERFNRFNTKWTILHGTLKWNSIMRFWKENCFSCTIYFIFAAPLLTSRLGYRRTRDAFEKWRISQRNGIVHRIGSTSIFIGEPALGPIRSMNWPPFAYCATWQWPLARWIAEPFHGSDCKQRANWSA